MLTRQREARAVGVLAIVVPDDDDSYVRLPGEGGRLLYLRGNDSRRVFPTEAYLATDPVSPMPAMLVKWLANNRRANAWNDTRQTAMAVYALAEYARSNQVARHVVDS